MKQHKWHKEIKAWADGAEIESSDFELDYWTIDKDPYWDDDEMKYRIKPQPKEPKYLYVYYNVENDEIVFETLENDSYHLEAIGKIKLEVEDE